MKSNPHHITCKHGVEYCPSADICCMPVCGKCLESLNMKVKIKTKDILERFDRDFNQLLEEYPHMQRVREWVKKLNET